jgi:hypothetical protein
MKLTINDSRKIFAIQEEFQKMFPYLKLEFFAKPSHVGGVPSKKEIKHPSKTLGECRAVHSSGLLTVTPQTTVGELEQNFRDNFDLAVQVFRKSGSAWIETSSTNGWTLEAENKLGEEMSNPESQEITEGNPPMTEER